MKYELVQEVVKHYSKINILQEKGNRRRGGIEPLGRQPSPDLKSGPSASQAHRGSENVWKARVSIPVPLAC
jgi:hypothetical protein